ncbi:MAG: hemolysin III family protein [Firmicutes bacterium]|nr:hemolysin III family protein [Bacillota bacterium]
MKDKDTELHLETSLVTLGDADELLARRAVKKFKKYQKNQEIRDQKLYTLGGEIFSAITHGITAAVGIAVLVICIVFATRSDFGARAIVSVSIFGACAFIGFTISTVYHSLAINTGKRVLRILDHCSIYFIIAGTYTPFSLIGIGGVLGWVLFSLNWGLAIIGCTLTAINMKKFKTFGFVCYLVMGWVGIAAAVPLVRNIGFGVALWLLVAGGVAYTLGAVIYKRKGKYMHGVWHLFTLAGLVLQFFSILFIMF